MTNRTLTYVEHDTCELINQETGRVPEVGEEVCTSDMDSGERIVGTVVAVDGGEVRLRVTEGTVSGDDDESDQFADASKWMVSGEVLVPGPDGGIEPYSGFVAGADATAADAAARAIIARRFGADARVPTLRIVPPGGGGK